MPTGPLGGPRPLVNHSCQFTIEALFTDREYIYFLRNILDDPVPAAEMTVDKSGVNEMEDFPPTLWTRLNEDRLSVKELLDRLEQFRDDTGDEDVLGRMIIKARLKQKNRIPRPFARSSTVSEQIVLEGTFDPQSHSSDIVTSMPRIMQSSDLVYDWTFNPDSTKDTNEILIVTGDSSVSISSLKELYESMDNSIVGLNDLIITCSVAEF